MAKYHLTIQFDRSDVEQINRARQHVVLMKSVAGDSGSQVTWVTFGPFETNTISWVEDYGIYASETAIEGGAIIEKTAEVNPVQPEFLYPFEQDAFADPTDGSSGTHGYGIKNQSGFECTFGLTQSVKVNGELHLDNPLHAVPVLDGATAAFTPVEQIHVLLAPDLPNGVVLSDIEGDVLTVDFTEHLEAVIHYRNGRFMMGPLS